MATKSKPRGLNDEQLLSLMALIKDSDSVELKLTLPEEAHRSVITALGLDPLEAEIRQVFFFDTPDLALNECRARGSGAPRPAEGRRHGGEAAARRARRPSRPDPRVGCVLRRGGRDARRLRLLGVDEGGSAQGTRAGRRRRGTAAPEAVLEGAAGVLRGARAGRDRARRLDDARSDLRAQAAPLPGGIRTQDGRGDVALPGRLPGPRAVDQVRAVGGVPGRGRDAGVPRRARSELGGRAGDEDAEGARVLRGAMQPAAGPNAAEGGAESAV